MNELTFRSNRLQSNAYYLSTLFSVRLWHRDPAEHSVKLEVLDVEE